MALLKLRRQLSDAVCGDCRAGLWPQHRLLYVRVPKSGNGSIMHAIKDVKKRRVFSRKIINGYRTGWTLFSFVRNPWARLVSVYCQKVGPNATSPQMVNGIFRNFKEYNIPVHSSMSFADFCDVVCHMPDTEVERHLRSQASFLVRNQQMIVPFVGRMERMAEDWAHVMQQAGLHYKLPHIHRTKHAHQHYSGYYTTDRLIDLVADRYADDIRYFKYDFERQS